MDSEASYLEADARGGSARRAQAVRDSRRFSGTRGALLAGGLLAAAVILYGGYAQHWSWAGINGRTATLWEWLNLLMLPFAVALLPLLLSRRVRLRSTHKIGGLSLAGVFLVIAVAGYTVPWGWTGFVGNTLWNWLELLALPIAVALTPVYEELKNSWSSRHSLVASVLLAVFVGVAIGGYVGDWRWTGFRGNTAWDWLHLLLLPLLIPIVLVPALMPKARAGMIFIDESGADQADDDSNAGSGVPEGAGESSAGSEGASDSPAGSA